jgi:hypothetical protein
MRRVVASSDFRSGNSRACGRLVLDLAADLPLDFFAALAVDFLTSLLADFFADLPDFFDDLERADALAILLTSD